jgi:hypothetical protein
MLSSRSHYLPDRLFAMTTTMLNATWQASNNQAGSVDQYSLPMHQRTHREKSLPKLPSVNTSEIEVLPSQCGMPGRKDLVPMKDVYLLSTELFCATVALLVVFDSSIAIWLGQINQLIAIGFLLSVMAICSEGLVLRTALVSLAGPTGSSIQDLDAVLRKDPFSSRYVHLAYRLLLLALFGLPLLLSAAYKTFTGGQSNITLNLGDGFFGYSSTPGKQRIGDGLSILADVYVPFWISPGLNRTYGFNMYIPSDNKTAVILDSPYPSYLTGVQSHLNNGEHITLSATINATVSVMDNPTEEERKSDDFWVDVSNQFNHSMSQDGDGIAGAFNALWAGMTGQFPRDFSVMYFSAWNGSRNETFASEAIRTIQTRRQANATWLITPSNITLINANLLPNSTLVNQSLLQDNALSLQQMFNPFLGEYDWHNRAGAFDFPYPDSSDAASGGELRYFQPVNTVPALAASMAWARITSLCTTDRPLGIQSAEMRALTGYEKAAAEVITVKSVPTIRKSLLLVLVVVINPVLAFGCVVWKALCYHHPIGDDVNVISILAAVADGDLSALRGASLTGKLSRKTSVTFGVKDEGQVGIAGTDCTKHHIVMALGRSGAGHGHIRQGVIYR